MRFIYGGLLTIVAFCLLSSSAGADGLSGGAGAGGGNGPPYCAGCGGGSWYWETANLNHHLLDTIPQIRLRSNSPVYRPEYGTTDAAKQKMKSASKKVLEDTFLRVCDSSAGLNSSKCALLYNTSGNCSSGIVSTGDYKGACESFDLKEIHENSESPIDSNSLADVSSTVPTIYNFRLWRQKSNGSFENIFERRVGKSGGDNADGRDEETWFCGSLDSCAEPYSQSGRNGGPFTPSPKKSYRETCKTRKRGAHNTKGNGSKANGNIARGMNAECYWEGNQIGDKAFPSLFAGRPNSTKMLKEAIHISWHIGPSAKIKFAVDGPLGYYYIVQIVAMDKREQIMPAGISKNSSDYPFTRRHCASTDPRPIRKVQGGSYAVYWCGNYLQAYMPNPATPPDDVEPTPSSEALLTTQEAVKVGDDALATVSLQSITSSPGEAVFPRYARLQEFTPQINYSNAGIPTGWSSSNDPSAPWVSFKAPYDKDFAYYKVDPDQIDRVGAPPVATGPPDKYGQYVGGATDWWMTSAQLTAPMQVTSAYDGSGTISNTDFEINWRVPSIPNPCREASPTPSVPDNANDNLVTDPWSSSPQSCDESVDANKKITNRVFNSWDEWLVALVVREDRQIKTINETPDYKYTPLSSLRCGNNNEFSQANSAWQDNCSGDNRWNGLTYTPLADPGARDAQKRSKSGSMQFAQGYLVARAPACSTSRAPETTAGQTTSNYCAGKPITSGPQMEATPGISSAAWQNKLVQLKWWERAALRIKADTNRKDNVRGFTLWSRDQVLGTIPNQFRLAPGWHPSFSTFPEDTTPFQGGVTPAALGQEKSNTNATEINTRSSSFELNFCRQALPEETSINTTTYNGNPFSLLSGDKKVPDQLTDKMPGSENCAGWSIKWKYKTQEEISGNNFRESQSSSYLDDQQLCNANKKDLPPVPNYTSFTQNPPDQIVSSVSKYGDYHLDPHGGSRDQYWLPAEPTGAGSLGSTFSSAKFKGAPYVGLRPGKDNASNNAAHCQEWVHGRPLKGKWQSSYAFKKLYQKGGIPDSGTPSSASNCNFKSGSIPAIINQYQPSETVGPQPSGGTQTCKRYYYYPRNTTPPASCDYISYNSRTRQKKYKCDWRVSGGGVYQSFGFWYRQSTKWEWYQRNEQNSCHVGSNQPTSYVGPGSDLRSSSPTSIRYSPGTVGGRGATFATDGDLQDNAGNYGNTSSNLVYRGKAQAWTTASPGNNTAQVYAKAPLEWTCSYKKSGYITNSAIPSNTTDLAGEWKNAAAAGVGWGVNNSGPRIYTGADWNKQNVGTYNENPSTLADSKRYINDGWGYMTQLSFDRLSAADLANPVGENLGSIGRAGDRRSGAGTPNWTNAGESGNCPVPDDFFRGKVYDPLLPQSNSAGDIKDSVYSAPGTCWRLLASYNTNAHDQWQYRIVKDDLKPGEGDDPQQLQKFVKVYNPRGSR